MMMTQQLNQVPFALPRYGNAREKNAFFVQSAGPYLHPMRNHAYSVIERAGGVPVARDTRFYNVEFLVANGNHFMQIMKELGIAVTHMLPVSGGYKCYKNGNSQHSICFIQKRTEKVSGAITYTAVLPMRDNALELLVPVQETVQQQDPFFMPAPPAPVDSFLPTHHPAMPEHPSLTPGVQISMSDLPAGM